MKTLFAAFAFLFCSCTYTITYNYNYCGQDSTVEKSVEVTGFQDPIVEEPVIEEPLIEEHVESEFNRYEENFTDTVIN
jgi:hypothetical protein